MKIERRQVDLNYGCEGCCFLKKGTVKCYLPGAAANKIAPCTYKTKAYIWKFIRKKK